MADNLSFDSTLFRGSGPTPNNVAQPPPPPIFTKDGFDLDAYIRNGGASSLSATFMVMFAARVAYTGNATLIADVSATLGCASVSVFNPASPLAPRFIRFTTQGGRKLYAICGTTNYVQWFNYFWSQGQVTIPNVKGRVFQAFADAAAPGWAAFRADVAAQRTSVVIVGHSLGGAVAQIWGHRLLRDYDDNSPRAIVTFGSPRVGDDEFAGDTWVPSVYRFTTEDDPVTAVPPRIFVRKPDGVGDVPLYIKTVGYKHGTAYVRVLKETGAFDAPNDVPPGSDSLKAIRLVMGGAPMDSHLLPNYARLCERHMNLRERVTPAQYDGYIGLDGRLREVGL